MQDMAMFKENLRFPFRKIFAQSAHYVTKALWASVVGVHRKKWVMDRNGSLDMELN